MDLKKAVSIIHQCIDALPKPDRRRIGFHAEKRTPVLCGNNLKRCWIAPEGIALAVCASTRNVPKRVIKNTVHWERREAILKGSHPHFNAALKRIKPKTLRKIMIQYA